MANKAQNVDSSSGCQPLVWRTFLKATVTGAGLGATLMTFPTAVIPVMGGVITSSGGSSSGQRAITRYRTLGSGKHSLKVTALGLGCMGMNYHRGPAPTGKP